MWRMDRNSPDRRRPSRERKPPRPLDAARLNEMALAYVARFATSAGKLSDYLRRKLREASPGTEWVDTVRGEGYVFVPRG